MVGGLSWGYVGPSSGYVGPSWGQCGPILGLCWPILGLCWPILGLSWPILGLCWPILRPMLAHLEAYVGPGWPILSHKIRKRQKNATSTKHRKTRDFLAVRGGLRLGRRPLSPTERRETPSARTRPGGPWPDLWGLRLTAGRRPKQTRGRYALGVIHVHVLGRNRGRVVCRGCGCCVGGCCWCGVTDALGVVLTSPCVRRGPGLRASRQHPSSEGGWQPGCTWRTPKSGEPSCTLSLRKREKQASTLATFVVTRGRCEPISSSGPSYCLLSLNPSQWSRV